jgi:signal transduction histidine kinase
MVVRSDVIEGKDSQKDVSHSDRNLYFRRLSIIFAAFIIFKFLLEPVSFRSISFLTDIWKFPAPEEERYAQHSLANDLTSFRLFSFCAALISLLFILVDMNRPVDILWVVVMRFLLVTLYVILLSISYYRTLSPGALQAMLMIQFAVTYLIYFLQAFLAQMPFFFLTNALLLFFYTAITVSGIRFRYGVIINVIVFMVFMLIVAITENSFYKSQQPNLLLNLFVSFIAGGLIETQKRKNFRQFSALDLLNQQKGRIISILSHDVSSPLQSTSGLLETYTKNQMTKEELDQFIPKVKSRLEKVSFLVYSLVRWSKSQMDGFKVHMAAVDLKSLIDENVNVAQPLADGKEIRIRVDCQPGLKAYGDPDMINLILRNLLSNAIKFTPHRGATTVKAFLHENRILLLVSNEGDPIPESVREELFTFQVKPVQGTAEEHGTGLGLAISQQFAVLNGGRIYLAPRSGKENTFCVELQEAQ